jgi:hypothetical protein
VRGGALRAEERLENAGVKIILKDYTNMPLCTILVILGKTWHEAMLVNIGNNTFSKTFF